MKITQYSNFGLPTPLPLKCEIKINKIVGWGTPPPILSFISFLEYDAGKLSSQKRNFKTYKDSVLFRYEFERYSRLSRVGI